MLKLVDLSMNCHCWALIAKRNKTLQLFYSIKHNILIYFIYLQPCASEHVSCRRVFLALSIDYKKASG